MRARGGARSLAVQCVSADLGERPFGHFAKPHQARLYGFADVSEQTLLQLAAGVSAEENYFPRWLSVVVFIVPGTGPALSQGTHLMARLVY